MADLARTSVLVCLLVSLLAAMLVAVPHTASADDAVEGHETAAEDDGWPEAANRPPEGEVDPPFDPADDATPDEPDVNDRPLEDDAGSEPDPVALEDLLLGDDGTVGDELLRPAFSDAARNVSVGSWVQGWPSGNLYGELSSTTNLVVYAPTDDHLNLPWHQLTTRLQNWDGSAGPEVVVPSNLQINRSSSTANARVTNAFYSAFVPAHPTNLNSFTKLAWFPEVSGTGATQFLSTNFSMRDAAAAGALGVSGTHYFFNLNVIPSAAGGAINAADRTQGRWFTITFSRTFDPVNPPPSVTAHPADVTVPQGEFAQLSGAASNATSQRWQVSTDGGTAWADVAEATGTSLEVGPTTSEMDGWLYRLVFTNASGSVESNPARLTVLPLAADPVILEHPEDVRVGASRAAAFSASAESESEMTVRWQRAVDAEAAAREEWVDIDGATSERYEITVTTLEMDGSVYRAVFTNVSGSVATDPATLSVWGAPAAHLSTTPRAVPVESLARAM